MERIGVLGARLDAATGKRRLLLPSDEFVLVDADASDDEIAARYGLDEVRRAPEIRVCEAVYVDGPLEGQTDIYAPVELGARTSLSRPTPSGREVLTYELVALPEGDEPGKLRFVS
ncbi:hypothetical protein G7043_12610 [Lentzea sp. NEAU-D13]|uniref:Uncharacterized protein n=1 Tax=Lentzea alba TaxID=2714351 RepID=A0A7C9RQP2_9PSEU|nr:hypothetical protein [Lentzea alba]NGY59763.1 hypothetical protein [Lentzea alba]